MRGAERGTRTEINRMYYTDVGIMQARSPDSKETSRDLSNISLFGRARTRESVVEHLGSLLPLFRSFAVLAWKK